MAAHRPVFLVGGFKHELNSFATGSFSLADIARSGYYAEGEAIFDAPRDARPELAAVRDVAAEEGLELIPTVHFWAASAGGPIEHSVYERARSLILDAAREHRDRLAAVMLPLHGATVTTEEEDPEGDLLERLREIVGWRVPIAATFDTHVHGTARMARFADALVGFKTHPHVDHYDAARLAMSILVRAVRGEVRPVTVHRKLRMLTSAEKQNNQVPGAYRDLIAASREMEARPGVLAVSIFTTQPWMDLPEVGWSIEVVTDGDRALGQAIADELGRMCWARREEFLVPRRSIAEALDHAAAATARPIVFADGADSTTAGGAGDGTRAAGRPDRARAARALDERPIEALLTVVDAPAVEACLRAGIGAEVELELGGTITPDFEPIRVRGRVLQLALGEMVLDPPWPPIDIGRMALLRVGAVDVVLSEHRPWHLDSAVYRHVGRDVRRYQVVQVKSAGGFRAHYLPIAAEIVEIATRGPANSDLTQLPFRRIPRPMWPFDPDLETPWAPGEAGRRDGRSRVRPVVAISRLNMPGNPAAALADVAEVREWPAFVHPTDAELRAFAPGATVLLCVNGDRIDAELLGALPDLRLVALASTGYDSVEVDGADALGIAVTNSQGTLHETTADLTFGLIIAARRRMGEAERYLRAGSWTQDDLDLMLGLDVAGATLGIVGYGQIGQAVARRAAAGFGMTVIHHSRTRRDDEWSRWVPFDDLLRESDIVSLHVPSTPETQHLIGERELRLMKPTATLVNAARGAVVDEAALARALREGWIGSAGLDVLQDEPVPDPAAIELLRRAQLRDRAPHRLGDAGGARADDRHGRRERARVPRRRAARHARRSHQQPHKESPRDASAPPSSRGAPRASASRSPRRSGRPTTACSASTFGRSPAGSVDQAFQVDLSDPAAIERLIAEAGPVDVLVNNAAVLVERTIDEHTVEDWDLTMNVNLRAPFLLSRGFGNGMRERRWGRIVNIASIAARTGGLTAAAAYAASKGGLVVLTKHFARNYGPDGVTVNAIAPAGILTPMADAQERAHPGSRDHFVQQFALRRNAEPSTRSHRWSRSSPRTRPATSPARRST